MWDGDSCVREIYKQLLLKVILRVPRHNGSESQGGILTDQPDIWRLRWVTKDEDLIIKSNLLAELESCSFLIAFRRQY